jgi:cytochrome b561
VSEPETYDRVQRTFHWTMAAIVLTAVLLGLWSSFLTPGTPFRQELLDVHKSLGLTAAMLILPRIVYRLLTRVPPDTDGSPLTRAAAHGAHLTLYALMLFMPITGYISSAAGGHSLPWFGLFQWPRLLGKDAALSHWGEWLHDHGAWVVYAVIAIHIAAVVWHQFYKKDGVLARMLPQARSRRAGG